MRNGACGEQQRTEMAGKRVPRFDGIGAGGARGQGLARAVNPLPGWVLRTEGLLPTVHGTVASY